jgi:hypothetical protein
MLLTVYKLQKIKDCLKEKWIYNNTATRVENVYVMYNSDSVKWNFILQVAMAEDLCTESSWSRTQTSICALYYCFPDDNVLGICGEL